MRIIAVPCLAKELVPGDLFSSVGPEYWDHAQLGNGPLGPAVGIKCYIRTQVEDDIGDADTQVFRLTILKEGPDMTQRIWTLSEIGKAVGVSRQAMWQQQTRGHLPSPTYVTGSGTSFWTEEQAHKIIEEWGKEET